MAGSGSTTISLAVPSPSPKLLELREGGGGGGLSGMEQIVISVSVSSVVLVTLLVVLVVAVVKLVQFIRTSQKFKKFVADASKAEFSRDRNPLYHPDHTPVKLPTHIADGNIDIKIPQCPSKHIKLCPSSKTGTSENHPHFNTTQNGMRPHETTTDHSVPLNTTQNGMGPRQTGMDPMKPSRNHTAVLMEGTNGINTCAMETPEQENGTRSNQT